MPKVSRSVTIDEELLAVVDELIPKRSVHAEQGLLDAVVSVLEDMKPKAAKPYRDRLKHLLQD